MLEAQLCGHFLSISYHTNVIGYLTWHHCSRVETELRLAFAFHTLEIVTWRPLELHGIQLVFTGNKIEVAIKESNPIAFGSPLPVYS